MIINRHFLTFCGIGLIAIAGCKTPHGESTLRDAPTFPVTMNIGMLRQAAFQRCQTPTFAAPKPASIPDLDPPTFNSHGVELHYLPNGLLAPEDGNGNYPADSVKGPGIDYTEEGLIQTSHDLYADQDFFFRSRPRAALNTLPVQLFVQRAGAATYESMTWEMAAFDYSNPGIQPPIDVTKLPAAGQVLTKLLVGHKAPSGGFPQIFDYGSTGYLRFQGYSQVPGASFRTAGAHNVFGTEFVNPSTNESTPEEDFGVLEAVFFSVKNGQTTNVLALVEGGLFCGAFDINLTPGEESVVDVDSYWYTRRDFNWQKEPNTGFVAYSSMYFQGVHPAADGHHDEYTDAAHDSDTLIVNYQDNSRKVVPIELPTLYSKVYNPPGVGTTSFQIGLTPASSAGLFQIGQTVEVWSQVAGGDARSSDGTKKSWKILATNPPVGTLTLEGSRTSAATITGGDILFVRGQRLLDKDASGQDSGKLVKGFLLENVDRNPTNYTYYRLALKDSSYEYRSSYGVEILESNVKTGVNLIAHIPNKEYLDNIVAFSTLRQNLPKSRSADDFSHFHYKTWSCNPGSPSCPTPN